MTTACYEALVAAGRAALATGQPAAAERALDAAVRLRPKAGVAHYLRGEALFLQRRLGAALACHARACACGIHAGVTRGQAMSGAVPGDFAWMTHMLRGDMAAAWRLADAEREERCRAGITGIGWPRHMRPVWDGAALAGRHVLVRCYHGLGDTVQFARYLPPLAETAASVTVEAQPELLRLLASLPGIAALHALPEREDRACAAYGCEVEIEIGELPHAFRSTLATLPAAVPYLRPDPAGVAAAAARLAPAAGRLTVGLVWAAGAWRPQRSIPFDLLRPLGAVPGVVLVSLQGGPEAAARHAGGDGPPLAEPFALDDVADTAAAIAALDLVISVDTMVAHLAGALGRPVWVPLHFAADWRWLLRRDDSPWYPTMRLFRQRQPGAWPPVVAALAAALRRRVAAGAIARPPARRGMLACAAAPRPR